MYQRIILRRRFMGNRRVKYRARNGMGDLDRSEHREPHWLNQTCFSGYWCHQTHSYLSSHKRLKFTNFFCKQVKTLKLYNKKKLITFLTFNKTLTKANFSPIRPRSRDERAGDNVHIIPLIVAVGLNGDKVVYGWEQGGDFWVKAVII